MEDTPKVLCVASEEERLEMVDLVANEKARRQVLNEAIMLAVVARQLGNKRVADFWDKISEKYKLEKAIHTFNEKTGEIYLSPQNKSAPTAPEPITKQ